MSASAASSVNRPALRIRGRPYPILLPTLRDPRLHLAAVIVSLQVLGQVALGFRLSIAQILVSLATCAVLEVSIAFWRQRVILWPASALLTGNGVAFVLRVPGTEHGDWWSMNGAWIFAGTSAVALLSKHVVRLRGRHVFNPSNIGLVLCFLLLSEAQAEPLALWWGPMSPGLALALVIILAGGLTILRRLRLLGIAVSFWLAFAAGIGVLAASGHEMTAPWHLGPLSGLSFWWVLVSSPEILVFLFFMITDPKTIPDGPHGRRVYAVSVALLATLLIAPQTSEYATKVAVLGALAIVCAARPVVRALASSRFAGRAPGILVGGGPRAQRIVRGSVAVAAAAAFAAVVALAGIPARPTEDAAALPGGAATDLPAVTTVETPGLAPIDRATARKIARDVVADLHVEAESLRRRDLQRAAAGATGPWLAQLWRQIRSTPGDSVAVPVYDVERVGLTLRRGKGQQPPVVVATLEGTVTMTTFTGPARDAETPGARKPVRRTVELGLERGRYLIAGSRGGAAVGGDSPNQPRPDAALGGIRFESVAEEVGLDFRQDAFALGVSFDTGAMMGGGLCWLDYDQDGWLDLYVTNAYADADYSAWEQRGGLPRSALFHNVRGTFEDVSAGSGADLQVRGSGCVAADFDLDGHTDLFVTTVGYNAVTNGYDALLWGRGDGTLHRGRPGSRDQHARLARRCGRGRRERRRAARSVRRGVHGPEHPGAGLVGRVPGDIPRRARPSLSQHGHGDVGPGHLP